MTQTDRFINRKFNLQVASYQVRYSEKPYISPTPSNEQEPVLEPEPKLNLVLDFHIGYCRGAVELEAEFGNPYSKRQHLLTLEKKL